MVLGTASLLLVAACGPGSEGENTTPHILTPTRPDATPEPTAEPLSTPIAPGHLARKAITFTVHVPANTPPGEQVYLLLKPMIDWWWAEKDHIPLTDNGDGTWSATASVPVGGFVQYVYDRWDEQQWGEPFKETREGAGRAEAIESRFLLVTEGLERVDDIVETWQDHPADALAGSITGIVVDGSTGKPVFDAEVTAGGMHTATVYGGRFELPRIAAGPQRVTVWHADGEYQASSAIFDVLDDAVTDVRVALEPAKTVRVTFDVALPSDTPPEAEIKLLGNVGQMGSRPGRHPNFPHMPDGALVPVLDRVSPGRAVATLDLHEGTFLSYYYTIANEFVGRDRPLGGGSVFREHIVDGADQTIRDDVATWWEPGLTRVTVRVRAPANTAPGAPLSSGGYWMTQVGDQWVTYREGRPGEVETFDVTLGRSSQGNPVGGSREFTYGDTDHELRFVIDRWEPTRQVTLATGAVSVELRVSIPASTRSGAELTLVVEGRRVAMTPQAVNPWMYEVAFDLPATGSYAYYVERGAGSRGPDRTIDARFDQHLINDCIRAAVSTRSSSWGSSCTCGCQP